MDVSVRAVIATDATNLTSTWAKISNQTTAGTFASAFNALLLNSGGNYSFCTFKVVQMYTYCSVGMNFLQGSLMMTIIFILRET